MSARFWTAAEILHGLDDEFAADNCGRQAFPVNRSSYTFREQLRKITGAIEEKISAQRIVSRLRWISDWLTVANSAWDCRVQMVARLGIWDKPRRTPTKRGRASSRQIFVLGSFFSSFARRDTGELHDPGGSLSGSILTEGRLERQFLIRDLG